MSYTSGKVSHDPLPWHCKDGDHRCPTRLVECTSGQGYATHPDSHEWIYAPRPEFDNHNPILAIVRADMRGVGRPLEWWLDWAESPVDYRGAHSRAQIDHARRVLSKLAALS